LDAINHLTALIKIIYINVIIHNITFSKILNANLRRRKIHISCFKLSPY